MTPAPAEAPLDRRRARSRAALLDAAETLFAARGVDAVSIDEIVAGADVAKGTFYNHFEDKDAIARTIAGAVRADIEDEVTAANAAVTDPALRCARALCIHARFATQFPVRAQALTRLHAGTLSPEAAINRGLRADIEAGFASGQLQAYDCATAMLFVGSGAIAIIAAVLNGAPAQVTAREIITLLLAGLGVRRPSAAAIARAASNDVFGTGERA